MKADRIIFGVTLLALGVVWFLINLGIIPPVTVRELWRYWPLLLVLWGLLLLTGKGDGFPGCLVAILVIVLLFGGIFTVFFPTNSVLPRETLVTSVKAMEGTTRMKLNLVQHAGELSLSSQRGANYVEASLQTVARPLVEEERAGDTAEIMIRDEAVSWAPFQNRLSRWELALAEGVPAEITLRTGATKAELDLSRLLVTKLNVKAGAGDLVFYLGSTDADVLIESGAGSITIYVPDETGIRLQASGGILTVNGENARIVSLGDRRYESRELSEKSAVADIQVTAGAGSVTLRRAN
jgi:predicted membrane protein